jgi:methionyl-tRNA formyltransferase
MTLRVGFAGTPAFAAGALAAIAEAGFTIPLVLTRPDKPKGRGLKVEASEVKQEAVRRGIRVSQPASLKSADATNAVVAEALDVLVVAAYGLILPPRVLDWPRHGCLNIHASRLPRWRGAAPIQRAIEAGDRATGITIMQMDAGLDTGPIVDLREVAIGPRETAATLQEKLARVGATAIVDVLARLDRDRVLASTPQPAQGVSYATKIGRSDARIDWTRDAEAIDRQVRAFDPTPGAFTAFDDVLLKIWRAEPIDGETGTPPGIVLSADGSLDVACGHGALRVLELQPAGGRRMDARAFASGRALRRGSRFVAPAE